VTFTQELCFSQLNKRAAETGIAFSFFSWLLFAALAALAWFKLRDELNAYDFEECPGADNEDADQFETEESTTESSESPAKSKTGKTDTSRGGGDDLHEELL
jgi:hypothetical protein